MTDAVSGGASSFHLDRSYAGWGIGAFVLAAFVIIAGNTNLKPGEQGGTGPLVVTLILCAVVGFLLFGSLVPGATRPERTGIIFAVLAVLSLLAFWSGLAGVMGPAVVALGLRAGTSGRARAVVGVGVVVTLLEFVAGIMQLVH